MIGLLCNGTGVPLSVEVFPGNTQDPKTVAAQVNASRDDKLAALRRLVAKENAHLEEHPRATVEKAHQWVSAKAQQRVLSLAVNEAARVEASRLSRKGCHPSLP